MGRARVRNPTLEQKKLISAAGLIARNWYVVKETDEELHLVSKRTGRSRKVRKEIKSHDRKRV